MKRFHFILRALMLGAMLAAAPAGIVHAQGAATGSPMLLPVDDTPLAVERDGKVIATFDIEVADSPTERSRGLMFRDVFPDDRAMLFVFEKTRPVAFWMQNTPRPLDMLFILPDGELSSIAADTTPFSVEGVPSKEAVRYVLEINAGLSARYGLKPGDLFVHPTISAGERQ